MFTEMDMNLRVTWGDICSRYYRHNVPPAIVNK